MHEHDETFLLAVNGTLMRGLELEHNMLNNSASFECEAKTAPSIACGASMMCIPA